MTSFQLKSLKDPGWPSGNARSVTVSGLSSIHSSEPKAKLFDKHLFDLMPTSCFRKERMNSWVTSVYPTLSKPGSLASTEPWLFCCLLSGMQMAEWEDGHHRHLCNRSPNSLNLPILHSHAIEGKIAKYFFCLSQEEGMLIEARKQANGGSKINVWKRRRHGKL